MNKSEDFIELGRENKIGKLIKSLYDLKQSQSNNMKNLIVYVKQYDNDAYVYNFWY